MARRQEDLRRYLTEVDASDEQLRRIKEEFAEKVLSLRRLESANSVADFLRLLDRRDLLNEMALERIRQIVGFTREALPEVPPQEINAMNAIQDGVKKVHELIASRIGRDWKNFARKLDVVESQIDHYDLTFNLDPQAITLQILKNFRGRDFFNEDEWLSKIRKALDYAKRNDIWENVDDLVIHLGGTGHLRFQ